MIEYCDLVMKGGITSGVVYPKAVNELSKRYRFKNIGGTSAGAIAAAATAAAEYRRRRDGSDEGFEKLARLPEVLASGGVLTSLFRPDRKTKSLFDTALAMMGTRIVPMKIALVVWALVRGFPILSAGAVVVASLVWSRVQAPAPVFWALGAAWVLTCILAVTLVAAARFVPRALHGNRFGLCNGFDAEASIGEPPLVNWLYGYLNELAEKPLTSPLTFGDLWSAPQNDDEIKTPRAINLEVLTTNLSHGRPYRVPFDEDVRRQFYFAPMVWKQFFPREVVEHLEAHSEHDTSPIPRTSDGVELKRLPPMKELPIIVAVRLSLSYPLLLSAVPLYAVDYSRLQNREQKREHRTGELPTAEPCWFSDGGICSNFPMHFFDAPISTWPTFGINLKTPHPSYNTEEGYVWLPKTYAGGHQSSWVRFDSPDAGTALFGFAHAIILTMQNWRDNLQTSVPGYRNRIVHISHTQDEGGLNLTMPSDVITRLSDRGRRAGLKLRRDFDLDTHMWIRYRSCMSTLIAFAVRFAEEYRRFDRQDTGISATIRQASDAPIPSLYKWRNTSDAQQARFINESLLRIAAEREDLGTLYDDGAPGPLPELRIVPRV